MKSKYTMKRGNVIVTAFVAVLLFHSHFNHDGVGMVAAAAAAASGGGAAEEAATTTRGTMLMPVDGVPVPTRKLSKSSKGSKPDASEDNMKSLLRSLVYATASEVYRSMQLGAIPVHFANRSMQPSSSSEDVAARAETNGDKTEAAAKDDDDYTGCHPGYYYEPLNMPEQGATYEASLAACNHRCRMVAGCVQFSYWPDNKSCNVQDDTSSLVPTPPLWSASVAGPVTDCGRHHQYDGHDLPTVEEVKAYSCDECIAFGKGVSKFPEDEQEEFCEIVAELLPDSQYPSTLYQDQCLNFLECSATASASNGQLQFGCCQVQGLCLDRGTPVGGTCAFDFNCVTPPGLEHPNCGFKSVSSPTGTCQSGQSSSICAQTSDCIPIAGMTPPHAVCRESRCQRGVTGDYCGQDEDCLSGFCRPTGKCGGNS